MHSLKKTALTNDTIIREALVNQLENEYASNPEYRVIPELGLWHGASRVDVAVVNGILHGFEIKSDRDTLNRLPSQREAYNAVFDKVTLVVGAKHFVDAFKIVPNWWGIETAHLDENGSVFFNTIREPGENPKQDEISIARLLWKNEALCLLESEGKAEGVRSKPRELVYARVAETIEIDVLKKYVRNVLQSPRQDWRSDLQLA
jgi:hypothetical protein